MKGQDSQLDESTRVSKLTQRECQVLALLASGCSVKEIGARLGIAEGTAGTHVTRIYEKLGVNKAIDAMRLAIRCGLLEP